MPECPSRVSLGPANAIPLPCHGLTDQSLPLFTCLLCRSRHAKYKSAVAAKPQINARLIVSILAVSTFSDTASASSGMACPHLLQAAPIYGLPYLGSALFSNEEGRQIPKIAGLKGATVCELAAPTPCFDLAAPPSAVACKVRMPSHGLAANCFTGNYMTFSSRLMIVLPRSMTIRFEVSTSSL